jgi:geranylgeranyl diphosphate synthase type II
MEYSLNAGGKRLRPALVLSFARLFGETVERVMHFAAALEIINNYSLIN